MTRWLWLPCAVALLLAIATRDGVVVTPDSVVYVGVASELANGHGLQVPFGSRVPQTYTAHPPGWPMMIAAGSVLTKSPIAAARWWVVLLGGLTVAAILLFGASLGRSSAIVLLFATCFISLPPILLIFVSCWSEPAFLFVVLMLVHHLVSYANTGRWQSLVIAGVAAALAPLIRFAGLPFTLAAFATIWWIDRLRGRSWRTALWIATVSLPAAAYAFFVRLAHAVPGGRALAWHPISVGRLLPVVALAAVGVGTMIWRRRSTEVVVPAFLATAYVGFLIVARLVADAQIAFDGRMLSPAIALACLCFIGAWTSFGRNVQRVVGVIACVLIAVNVTRDRPLIGSPTTIPIALNQYRDSEMVRWAAEQAPDRVIYSNAPDVVYLFTGRPARFVPFVIDPHSREPVSISADDRRDLGSPETAVVIADDFQRRTYLMSAEALERTFGFHGSRLSGAAILRH